MYIGQVCRQVYRYVCCSVVVRTRIDALRRLHGTLSFALGCMVPYIVMAYIVMAHIVMDISVDTCAHACVNMCQDASARACVVSARGQVALHISEAPKLTFGHLARDHLCAASKSPSKNKSPLKK